jgi:hypothetical protein
VRMLVTHANNELNTMNALFTSNLYTYIEKK